MDWTPCFPRSQDLRTLLVLEAHHQPHNPLEPNERSLKEPRPLHGTDSNEHVPRGTPNKEKDELIISKRASHCAFGPEWGGRWGPKLCICGPGPAVRKAGERGREHS